MPKISEVTPFSLSRSMEGQQSPEAVRGESGKDSKDFGETVVDFLGAVNESQKEAAEKVADVLVGNSENLHEAMATLEEAKLSFELMLEIRNKLMESYQEIQRIQV